MKRTISLLLVSLCVLGTVRAQENAANLERIEIPVTDDCSVPGPFSNVWDDQGILLMSFPPCPSPALVRVQPGSPEPQAVACEFVESSDSTASLGFSAQWNWRIGRPAGVPAFAFVVSEPEPPNVGLPIGEFTPYAESLVIGEESADGTIQLGPPFAPVEKPLTKYVMTLPVNPTSVLALRSRIDKATAVKEYDLLFVNRTSGEASVLDTGLLTCFDVNPATGEIFYVKENQVMAYSLVQQSSRVLATLENAGFKDFDPNSVVFLAKDNALLVNNADVLNSGALWSVRLQDGTVAKAPGQYLLLGKVGTDYALCREVTAKKYRLFDASLSPLVEFSKGDDETVLGCRPKPDGSGFEVIIRKKSR